VSLDPRSLFEVALFDRFVDFENLSSHYESVLVRLQIRNVIDKDFSCPTAAGYVLAGDHTSLV
jgi:hypothetical protein